MTPAPGETLDLLCQGRLPVFQRKDGYRFSIDAFILANFVVLKKHERLLDIGTGCGIIPIYIAKRGYRNYMVGIEIQDGLFRLAQKNGAFNGVDDRIEFMKGDIKIQAGVLRSRRFDVVVSNPPFTRKHAGRQCPSTSRRIARYETELDLAGLVSVASMVLDQKGRFYLIYPARRLGELVCEAGRSRLALKRLRMVHPRPEEDANLFVAEFMKDGGPEARIEKPLYIYENCDYSAEVKQYYSLEG